jgi:putative lipoic acid-binding regulatory protein
MDAGIDVLREPVEALVQRRYVSVRISFRADSREQYDLAHQVLRDHPEVK